MTYRVFGVSSAWTRSKGECSRYVVANRPASWDNDTHTWPNAAEFPVAAGYSEEDQERRAHEYAAYMNSCTPVVLPPIGVPA